MIKILLVEDDLGLSNSVFDFLDDFADVMQLEKGTTFAENLQTLRSVGYLLKDVQ